MITRIEFIHYRKLINLGLDFKDGINIISGTNGTCKTSILHIISNSFQRVPNNAPWLTDRKCIRTIAATNTSINPKIETLTREAKKYSNPASGIKGSLYNVTYSTGDELSFRRHNVKGQIGAHSSSKDRYSVKLKYSTGQHQSLPVALVVYMGLSRLYPFGEFDHDDDIQTIQSTLPQAYLDTVCAVYKKLTGREPKDTSQVKIGSIKKRAQFSTEFDGIDSNTISDGEDNLYGLLIALESLKYYSESCDGTQPLGTKSYLVVDEVDATLHPDLQIDLLDRVRSYCENYSIQAFFTSHSLPLLEEALRQKDNVIYLVNNDDKVTQLTEPNLFKIKKHLSYESRDEKYYDKKIPILTEDEEARFILKELFEFFKKRNNDFTRVVSYYHIPSINLGADQIKSLFKNDFLFNTSSPAIGVLDGDQFDSEKKLLSNSITVLPGKKSPEMLLYEYSKELYYGDSEIWKDKYVVDSGYSKEFFRRNILDKPQDVHSESTKEMRQVMKDHFNENKQFYTIILRHWIHNAANFEQISKFFDDLFALFKKQASMIGLDKEMWNVNALNDGEGSS